MSRFTFELANQTDDFALQHLMEETPIEGGVKVIFQRKPSYFIAARVEGNFNQTLVCRDNQKNAIVAVGSRSIKPAYINGRVMNIGYLSRLRILPEYRNTTLLARGYQYLKNLHQDNRAPFYITTIIEDNSYSLNMLTKRRAGLPSYLEWGSYYTALIKPNRKKEDIKDGLEVIKGSLSYIDRITEFLNKQGSKKQFFPYYSKEDLVANNGMLKDLEI